MSGHADTPYAGVIARYEEFLPVRYGPSTVTLLEGNTPLIAARRLADRIAPDLHIFLKIEGMNPTGSFKDRGMTVAVSHAVQEGTEAILCASTGNTSASAAAYAARAGLRACVVVPEGQIASGKLSQALVHGAQVIQIQGNFDAALTIVRTISEQCPVTLVNSVNPYRIEGQKTAAFEVCDTLGRAPDYHFLPVGNAGNITAYWKGYAEYRVRGCIDRLPAMMGFQAEGAAPIVRGHVIERPQTVATAIRIGNPASWQGALRARDESGGVIEAVSDEAIMEAYHLVAAVEGLFCEPASAAGIAGLVIATRDRRIPPGSTVVVTLTGSGLKDPDCAQRTAAVRPVSVVSRVDAVKKALGL